MKMRLLLISLALIPGSAFGQSTAPILRGQVHQNGLIAEYRMVNRDGSAISGTALPEFYHSDGSLDGTLTHDTGGSGTPATSAQGVSFTNNSSKQEITLPTGALSGWVAVSVWLDVSVANSSGGNNFYFGTTPNTGLGLNDGNYSTGYGNSTAPFIDVAGSYKTTSLSTCTGVCNIVFVLGSSSDTYYINGLPAGSYFKSYGDLGGVTTSGLYSLGYVGGGLGQGMTGKIYWVDVWNSAPTAAQVWEDYQFVGSLLQSQRGLNLNAVPTTSTNQLVCIGDSLTLGANYATKSYCNWIAPTDTFATTVLAKSATCAQTMLDTAPGEVDPLYAPRAGRNVFVLWAGHNDLQGANPGCTAHSPASTYQNIRSIALGRRKAGWSVIVVGIISGTGTGYGGASFDSLMDQENALIFGNCYTFADACVYDPTLMVDGAYTNSTWFGSGGQYDGTHPVDAGYKLIAAGVQAAINGLAFSTSPKWYPYTVTKIASGTNGCANANGCWQVNGGGVQNAAAALTQPVVLFQLPANGTVQQVAWKTATACTGPSTIRLTGLGTAGTATQYYNGAYDLAAAPAASNFGGSVPALGSDTRSATNVTATITTTGTNVDQIAAGCSLSADVLWSVVP